MNSIFHLLPQQLLLNKIEVNQFNRVNQTKKQTYKANIYIESISYMVLAEAETQKRSYARMLRWITRDKLVYILKE